VIVGLVLLVVALAAALWALNSRVTVVVHAPSAQVRQVPVSNEVIPIADTASDTPAVIAAPISTEAEFTVTGQVATQTTSPTSRAKGTVTIINTIEQALALPEGTEFIGKNAAGAEVRFAVDAPATVPAASTSASLTGRSTTYGQAQVAITARSPGAASNVPENTIKQILIPGQPLLDCGTSNFVCQSGPIAGGADEPQWVVTDADVQRVLGEALTGLYNTGIQQLRAQSVDGKSVVDETAITPDPQALGRPESYEPPLVTPPVGQVADPNTRSFTVLVRTRFTALAVPPDRLMKDQIAKVISAHFAQRSTPICSSAELMRPSIDRWIWDGASLKVNGLVTCEPTGALAPEVRLLVREALRGKTRAQAEAALQELRDRGLIGDVQIPDSVTTMPPCDVLREVQFADAAKP
jgi:hypothetical protein